MSHTPDAPDPLGSVDEDGLDGLVALVTGGTRGIGLGIVQHLLRKGTHVWMTSTSPSGDDVAEALGALYGKSRVAHSVSNVASRDDVADCVRRCVEHFGALDIAVANAGTYTDAKFLDMNEEQWSTVVAVNLTGAFHTIQLSAREMVERGGRIVVVGSTNGFFVEANFASYNASKAGLIGMVRSAALELASQGVTVNTVSPGLVATRMSDGVVSDAAEGPKALRGIPVGRFGTPADVAAAVGYLVSPTASWITGQEIVVDGGQTLGRTMPPATPTESGIEGAHS